MRVFSYLKDIYDLGDTCIALGNFDGVHIGHQKIISTCVDIAKEKDLTPALFTFSTDPVNEIAGRMLAKPLVDIKKKTELIEALGIELMVSTDFDPRMRDRSADNFVERVLVKFLHPKHVVCGFNYHFGKDAAGDAELLTELGKKYGFDVTVIDPVCQDGEVISSTLIRKCIEEGNYEKANKLLGWKLF